MTADELRALADALETTGRPGGICQQAANYLRAQAEAEPIHAYEWDWGDTLRRSFSPDQWNGRAPDRTVLLCLHPAPATPKEQQ